MAENHPVGFRWVDRGARARRHDHPRRSAVHAHVGDGRPLGAAARRARDIVFLGGADQLRPRRTDATSASTSSTTPTPRRSSAKTSRTPRISMASSRAGTRRSGSTTPSPGSTRARRRRAGESTNDVDAATAVGHAPRRAAARLTRADATRRCSIRAASYQILKRHFARYTPEMVEQVCGVPRDAFLAGGRRATVARRGPRRPERSATRSAGRSTRPACRSSAPRRSCSCCSATSAARAAASWRCAATRRSRARPTFRRCTTCCPATCRCRTSRRGAHSLRRLHRRSNGADAGWWRNIDKYIVSLLKAWYGDAATAGQRLRLRLAAADHRRPLALRLLARHGRRQGRRALRDGTEPGRRRRRTRGSSAARSRS